MKSFQKALKNRYPNTIITVRPDVRLQTFIALAKDESGWKKLNEKHCISPAIMLPGYVVRDITLPDGVDPDSQEGSSQAMEVMLSSQ
jgi:hypothetical protein